MAEFTPIETQEQFDAAIGERLKRERDSLAKKYGDYEDLKKKAAEQETKISELSRSIEETTKKYSGFEKTKAELEGRIKGYETNSVKMRIAHETGIPFELANRLTGEDEDAIRKDAELMAGLLASKTPADPLGSTEHGKGDSEDAPYRNIVSALTNKGE